jgi:hypothetical protein
MRSLGAALLVALAMAGLSASPAWANAKGVPTIECSSSSTLSVTWTFSGFPNAEDNVVKEVVKIDGVVAYKAIFTFNGPSGTNMVTIPISPGPHEIRVHAGWNTNGVKGETDRRFTSVECARPEPAFTVEKLQRIEGEPSFTAAPLTGEVGQTVDYELIVKDTGNTTLTFSNFEDANCEGIAGGPSGPLAPGEEATYTCSHLLTTAGTYENNATVTATPPEKQGEAITHTSNTVVVNATEPKNAKGVPTIECSSSSTLSVTWMFSGFPNAEDNVVKEVVKIDGVVAYKAIFTFNGPSGTNMVTIPISPGPHEIRVHAGWNTNGVKGETDRRFTSVECARPEPAFTVEKLQRIEGEPSFTAAPLTGEVGQTVDYELIVKDTGNTTLTFSNFEDANCEGIAGGPSGPLAPGEEATYTCSHLLTTAGTYENNATVTATPA